MCECVTLSLAHPTNYLSLVLISMTKEPYYFMDEEDKRRNEIVLFVKDAMPDSWRACASELYRSAELLWNDKDNELRLEAAEFHEIKDGKLIHRSQSRMVYSVSRSYFLLAGFALENLIKGYLVACDPTLINHGALSKEIKTHELSRLARKIEDFKISKNELDFCCIAEKAIPYWGRYPVPLISSQVAPEVGLTDELRQGFLSFYDRLDEKLYMKIRNGWDSGVGAKLEKLSDKKYDLRNE